MSNTPTCAGSNCARSQAWTKLGRFGSLLRTRQTDQRQAEPHHPHHQHFASSDVGLVDEAQHHPATPPGSRKSPNATRSRVVVLGAVL